MSNLFKKSKPFSLLFDWTWLFVFTLCVRVDYHIAYLHRPIVAGLVSETRGNGRFSWHLCPCEALCKPLNYGFYKWQCIDAPTERYLVKLKSDTPLLPTSHFLSFLKQSIRNRHLFQLLRWLSNWTLNVAVNGIHAIKLETQQVVLDVLWYGSALISYRLNWMLTPYLVTATCRQSSVMKSYLFSHWSKFEVVRHRLGHIHKKKNWNKFRFLPGTLFGSRLA